MNIVPNDILSMTKVLRMIFSHTIPWSHKNQARYVLKQWKTHEMLQLFHSHVSHVSWSCCIVLTNHVSLKCVVYVCTWVLHPIHFINKHKWYMTICYNVSRACFMQYELINGWMMLMFMKCKCNCGSQTPGVLQGWWVGPACALGISGACVFGVPSWGHWFVNRRAIWYGLFCV